jgi:hypothetical protein
MSDTTTPDGDVLFLNGKRHVKQKRYARDRKTSTRNIGRRRQEGMPWLDWAGEIWIPEEEADAFVLARVRRPSPARARRRQRSSENQIAS